MLKLDGINPQVSARMVNPFTRWRKLDKVHGAAMKKALERIAAKPGLNVNAFELVTKSLA